MGQSALTSCCGPRDKGEREDVRKAVKAAMLSTQVTVESGSTDDPESSRQESDTSYPVTPQVW